MLALLTLALLPVDGSAAAPSPSSDRDPLARSTAVALNYCRASLHRIRTQPTPQVLADERDRVLDNLSLDAIADAEVIRQ